MPPWLFLALLVTLVAALGYQIIEVRSLRRVPVYWAVILAAFILMEAGAESAHIGTPQLGELQVIPDLLGVGLALGVLRLAHL